MKKAYILKAEYLTEFAFQPQKMSKKCRNFDDKICRHKCDIHENQKNFGVKRDFVASDFERVLIASFLESYSATAKRG